MKFDNHPSRVVGHELVYFSCILIKFMCLRKYLQAFQPIQFFFLIVELKCFQTFAVSIDSITVNGLSLSLSH